MLSEKFTALTQALQILPSVGQKSAQRMAMQLLLRRRDGGVRLAESLLVAMNEIQECALCHSFCDDDICQICADGNRDERVLCVVESVADVLALEQSGAYKGRYFVLGGHLSPIDGIGAEQLNFPTLKKRLQTERFDELILALTPTVEGQATALFVLQIAQDLVGRITRIATGVPMGGELEYLDALTIGQALSGRTQAQ